MSQKDLSKLYDNLFSLGIIINVKVLILLRSLYEILSGLGADKSLHLLIALLNSSFKNSFQLETCLDKILSKISVLT